MIPEQAEQVARKYGIDLTKLQFQTMMMSMLFGLIAPGAYTLLAYFMRQGRPAQISPAPLETFFWAFIAISVVELGVAFFVRQFFFSKPLIQAESTFAHDFTAATKRINIIISAFVHSMVLYGLMQFFMGAELEVVMLFAIFSVISFQLLRFRKPFLEKVLMQQHEFVTSGRFGSGVAPGRPRS